MPRPQTRPSLGASGSRVKCVKMMAKRDHHMPLIALFTGSTQAMALCHNRTHDRSACIPAQYSIFSDVLGCKKRSRARRRPRHVFGTFEDWQAACPGKRTTSGLRVPSRWQPQECSPYPQSADSIYVYILDDNYQTRNLDANYQTRLAGQLARCIGSPGSRLQSQ